MRLLIPVLLLAARTASANCGNDKDVGQGCNGAPASASASVMSTSTVDNVVTVAPTQSMAGGQASSSVMFTAPRAPVATAYAPPVQATATCAIPLSAGLSFINFGGSFGTAYIDQNCALLEQVRAVAQLGDTETAFEMLCASKAYASAREKQGRPCRK